MRDPSVQEMGFPVLGKEGVMGWGRGSHGVGKPRDGLERI